MGLFDRHREKKRIAKLPPFDLTQFGADMHSHLIPGIDDGSQSMDQSIAMMAKFESLGYTKLITTPHIMGDFYKNTPETILGGLEKVREASKAVGLKIQIDAAAEYYFDESLMNRLLNKEPLLTFGDNKVLFEYSMLSKPDQIDQLLFEFLTQGYTPVLAHFERYTYYYGSVDQAEKWREKGVEIQMNLNSLTGHYGPEVRKQAELMIDRKVLDYAVSDCHRIEHLMLLEKNLAKPYFHKLGELGLKNNELIG